MFSATTIKVRIEVLADGRWTQREQTGASAEAFRSLLMEMAGSVSRAKGELCRSRRKLGAALLQLKRQLPYGQWSSFVASLEINQKTVSNAIKVVCELCDENGEFVQSKIDSAAAARPNVTAPADIRNMTMLRAEQLAGARPATRHQTSTEFGTIVPNSGGVRENARNIRTDSEFGTIVPNSGGVRDAHKPVAMGAGHQMTFEDLRRAAINEVDRLRLRLASPEVDHDLVAKFHAWALQVL